MATTSESIKSHPIKEGLTTFRHHSKTTRKDLGISVSSDAVQAIFSTATNDESMAQNLGIGFLC